VEKVGDMCNRLDTMPACDGQTKRTDILPRYSPRYAYASRGKNHDLRRISGFISELMQDRAIVTMDSE